MHCHGDTAQNMRFMFYVLRFTWKLKGQKIVSGSKFQAPCSKFQVPSFKFQVKFKILKAGFRHAPQGHFVASLGRDVMTVWGKGKP